MAPSRNSGVSNSGVPARRTGTVNERLAYLFATVHAPDARPYSCPEVARGVAAVGGSVSAVYLKKLLSGERGEPTLRVLRGLADFFGVPLSGSSSTRTPIRSTGERWTGRSACAPSHCRHCWPQPGS